MKSKEEIARLIDELGAAAQVRKEHFEAMFEISCPKRHVKECLAAKRRFLAGLARVIAPLFLRISDLDSDTPSTLLAVAGTAVTSVTWSVGSGTDFATLDTKVLHLGNWLLYSCDRPLPESVVRTEKIFKPSYLDAVCREHSVAMALVSFADDNPWLLTAR